jgi:hypothetical protein
MEYFKRFTLLQQQFVVAFCGAAVCGLLLSYTLSPVFPIFVFLPL